jgi:hypothetical protein
VALTAGLGGVLVSIGGFLLLAARRRRLAVTEAVAETE